MSVPVSAGQRLLVSVRVRVLWLIAAVRMPRQPTGCRGVLAPELIKIGWGVRR